MLTEFESRLADVLGSRLPAPFGGRVRRRGDPDPPGAGPVVRLGIDALAPWDPDVGSVRPEVVPGSPDQRRVLRLEVSVGIDVVPETAGDSRQELLGIDALVYLLGDPGLRSGALLTQPGDQGFVLDRLFLAASDIEGDGRILVRAEGWFWPVGAAGAAGIKIDRALIREFRLPVYLEIGGQLIAGGGTVPLDVGLGAAGTLEVTKGGVSVSPFGTVAMRVLNAGGGPGAGTLSGGRDGPDGSRVVDVAAGIARASYAPGATAGVDLLVVQAFAEDADADAHLGIELARFDLVVRS